jgi:DNA-directed RNA polymerase specialized sigma24 family protein
VQRYAGPVRAAATRVARGRGLNVADDVQQTVFLNIWRQLTNEQTITNPASYVYKCAVRETVRLLSAEDRLPTTSLDDDGADPAAAADQEPSAVSAAVAAGLTTLSEERRRAVRAHLEGFSVAEIMDMHGWTYQRARNLIARGMSDLRLVLREQGIDGD